MAMPTPSFGGKRVFTQQDSVMMDAQRKKELFERYDFSKTAILKRAGVDPQSPVTDLYHDIAGMVQSLVFECDRFGDPEIRDIEMCATIQDRIYRNYGWLQSQYQTIQWEELSAHDSDLNVFFQMRAALKDLGRILCDLLEESRKALAQGKSAGDHPPFRDIIEKIGTLMQAYRETREKIERSLASSDG